MPEADPPAIATPAGNASIPSRLRPVRWQARPGRPGRMVEDAVDSAALRDNPLGDPSRRRLYVWVPPVYDEQPDVRCPVVYVLPGYGSCVEAWLDRELFEDRKST